MQKSNEYGAIITREIQAVHKFVKDEFFKKFQELESIVVNPVDYVRCVKLINEQRDLEKANFQHLLSSHQLVAVKVAASSSISQELSASQWERILRACDIVIRLDECQ